MIRLKTDWTPGRKDPFSRLDVEMSKGVARYTPMNRTTSFFINVDTRKTTDTHTDTPPHTSIRTHIYIFAYIYIYIYISAHKYVCLQLCICIQARQAFLDA